MNKEIYYFPHMNNFNKKLDSRFSRRWRCCWTSELWSPSFWAIFNLRVYRLKCYVHFLFPRACVKFKAQGKNIFIYTNRKFRSFQTKITNRLSHSRGKTYNLFMCPHIGAVTFRTTLYHTVCSKRSWAKIKPFQDRDTHKTVQEITMKHTPTRSGIRTSHSRFITYYKM
jgi:hypothetical protein